MDQIARSMHAEAIRRFIKAAEQAAMAVRMLRRCQSTGVEHLAYAAQEYGAAWALTDRIGKEDREGVRKHPAALAAFADMAQAQLKLIAMVQACGRADRTAPAPSME